MPHRRILLPVIALVLAPILLAGCSSAKPKHDGQHASGPTISLKSLMFMPEQLTVKAGQTVTWRNDEPISHTVTSGTVAGVDAKSGLRSDQHPNGLFDARLPTKGSTFSFTFTKPGTYPYYCDIHQAMNASIVVTP